MRRLTKTITTMAAVLFSASAMAVLPFELPEERKMELLEIVMALSQDGEPLPNQADWHVLGPLQYKIGSYGAEATVTKANSLLLADVFEMPSLGDEPKRAALPIFNPQEADDFPIGYISVRLNPAEDEE